jgi:uncharacterized protein YqeY
MSLLERIDRDHVAARKRRDELSLATLGLLKIEVVKAGKEPGATGAAGDEAVLRVIRREVKRRHDAAAAYAAAGRAASQERELAEARVLNAYLPASLGDAEVEREVRAAIAEVGASGPRDLGAVMKAARERLAGRAESARIAEAARRLLSPPSSRPGQVG